MIGTTSEGASQQLPVVFQGVMGDLGPSRRQNPESSGLAGVRLPRTARVHGPPRTVGGPPVTSVFPTAGKMASARQRSGPHETWLRDETGGLDSWATVVHLWLPGRA